MTPNAQAYIDLWIKLDIACRDHGNESREADSIRDECEKVYSILTYEEWESAEAEIDKLAQEQSDGR